MKRKKYPRTTNKNGFRSGLEEQVATQLGRLKVLYEYETIKVKYVKPVKSCTYTPDFKLPNGIIIETKGRFTSQDRLKHLLIQLQCPEYDIRFVFGRAKNKLSKSSSTTYADWCDKHGFKYAEGTIPLKWIKEKGKV